MTVINKIEHVRIENIYKNKIWLLKRLKNCKSLARITKEKMEDLNKIRIKFNYKVISWIQLNYKQK